ncbi:MAG: hypothetical protein OJF49_001861 [Ktedonobacterales bacterium]|nr:MAG: hypothetical protein OJF49_001861 [Ktedonobacterales bacterium]
MYRAEWAGGLCALRGCVAIAILVCGTEQVSVIRGQGDAEAIG